MSHNYPCDWKAGFVMDPSKKMRVGYLLQLEGSDWALNQDIQVFSPFQAGAPAATTFGTAASTFTAGAAANVDKCVGIIEAYNFEGGVGDAICISAYISAESGAILKGKMQSTLTSTLIKKLGWWIVNFDEDKKVWYEEAYPKTPDIVQGQLNAPGGKDIRLHVADDPTKVHPNIDVNVYNLYFEVVPAANNLFTLQFATSSTTPFMKNWGLKVGTVAAAQFT